MGKGVDVSKHLRSRILRAFQDGVKQAGSARRFSLVPSTVSRIISYFNERNNLNTIPKLGRPRKMTAHKDRLIKRISVNDPWKFGPQIKVEIPHINISSRTIQRRLVDARLYSRRPAKKPLISARNRAARLAFARRHINWTAAD